MSGLRNRARGALGWMDRNPGKSGALAGWFQQAASAGVALLMVPVLTSHLSPTDSGLWFSFQGMVAIAGLANFGIGQVVTRQTAYCLGAQSAGERDDFLDFGQGEEGVRSLNHYSALIYLMVVALAVLIGICIFEFVIPHTKLLHGPQADYRLIWYLMLSAGVALILTSRSIAFLIGSGRTHVAKLLGVGYSTAQGVGVMAAVWIWKDLLPMAIVSLVTSLVFASLQKRVARRLVPGVALSSSGVTREKQVIRRLFKISFPLGIVNIGGYLFSNIQVPLIGSLLGPAVVTPYYLVQKLAQFVVLGCQQSLQPQLPRFTRLIAADDPSGARALIVRAMKYYCTFVGVAAVGFLVGAPFVLEIMAKGISPLPFPVIGFMAVDLTVLAVTVALSHLVLASGKNPFVLPTLLGGLTNLLLILFLVPRLGLVGLPLATLMSGLATSYFAGAFHGWKLINNLKSQTLAANA